MPIITGGVITQNVVMSNVQFALLQLRHAYHDVQDLEAWLAGITAADLQALGFSGADAQAVLNAVADAAKEADLHDGGGLGTYTLPYVFAASQNAVIGPLRS